MKGSKCSSHHIIVELKQRSHKEQIFYNYSNQSFIFSLSVQFFRDVAWKRDILSLRVNCKKSDTGCDWIGQLRHYEVLNVYCLNIGCF